MQRTTRFPSCGGDCEHGLGIESLHAGSVVGWGKTGSLPGVDANVFWFPEADLSLVIFANWGAGNHKDRFGSLFGSATQRGPARPLAASRGSLPGGVPPEGTWPSSTPACSDASPRVHPTR